MRRSVGLSILWLLLCGLAAHTVSAQGASPAARVIPYPVRTAVLDNGLGLVMVKMPTPGVVNYETVVRAGSRNEVERGRTGYAHFFEHMMFRGTPKHPQMEYSRTMDMLGADGNASTGNDMTGYYMTLPASGLPEVIELEADRFMNLHYTEEQFRKEAGAVLGEFSIGRGDPGSVIEETRAALAFQRHTYGHTTIGYEADVRSMPEGYAYSLAFYDHYYRPESCVILVTGDFDPDDVERRVREQYAGWKRGGPVPEVPREPPLTQPVSADLKWEGPTRPMVDISFRTPAYSESTRETAALEMIAALWFGETSPIHRDLVLDRRIAESIGARYERTRDPGLFTITASLPRASAIDSVRAAVLATVAEAAKRPIDAKRLADAKRRALASLALTLETPGGVAWRFSEFISLTGDPRSIERHYANVEAVTPEDLTEAAGRYFDPSRTITVTLVGKEGRP
jgi:zinc protease